MISMLAVLLIFNFTPLTDRRVTSRTFSGYFVEINLCSSKIIFEIKYLNISDMMVGENSPKLPLKNLYHRTAGTLFSTINPNF